MRKMVNLIILLFTLLAMLPVATWANGAPTVSLSPVVSTVNVGDTVNVNIRVDGVSDLYAAEIHFGFDAARLQALDDDGGQPGIQILPGSLFPHTRPSYVVQNIADNSAGTADFAMTLLAPAAAVSGSGTLATIRFAARMAGQANLNWVSVKMTDRNGATIAHTTVNGQIVINTPSSPPPSPPDSKDCTDLIDNGNLEATRSWDMPVTPHQARYSNADKHGGARSMRLGVEPGAADVYSHSSSYQKVRVPANAASATLTFWARRYTQETPKAVADPTTDLYDPAEVINGTFEWNAKAVKARQDWQEVLILKAGCYNWLATLMRERSNDGVWTKYTYDVSAFIGQEIVVYFNVINNGAGGRRTWMYVDDVRLDACYGAQPCAELVKNRSFEWAGRWRLTTTPRPANYTTDYAHTGARSMRLGVTSSTWDTYSHSSAYQHINIPSGAVHPTLSFWYKAHSEDTTKTGWNVKEGLGYDPAKIIAGQETAGKCCGEVDWQEMLLLNTNYQLLSGGVVLRQVRNDGVWRQATFDLSPYKGQEIVLYFNVINDGNGKRTWMYIDDVSVNLCGQQVHFDPASTQMNTGATRTVDVRVENIGNLYGFETTIRFDPAILQVVDADSSAAGVQVKLGDWMPAGSYVVQNSVNNTTGEIHLAASLTHPAPALNGSGDIISIPFKAKAAGTSPVWFAALKLVNASAVVIPTTHADGQVTVGSGQTTLSGRVLLQGRTDHSGTVVKLDGGTSVTTNANGQYSFASTSGSHTLTFSHVSYLGHTVTTANSAVPVITLLGGNVNADNCINILDLSTVAAQFGSTSPSPAAADINHDGKVDIVDVVLVGKNFGQCH